jgi:hypothetical protein
MQSLRLRRNGLEQGGSRKSCAYHNARAMPRSLIDLPMSHALLDCFAHTIRTLQWLSVRI